MDNYTYMVNIPDIYPCLVSTSKNMYVDNTITSDIET